MIDADRLKSYIDCGHLRPPTEVCFSELDVRNMIDKAPTVSAEAVQVVRCRECKWHRSGQNEVDTWSICIEPTLRAAHVQDDDYCSWGERKEATDEYH